jgi:hypothetical protein
MPASLPADARAGNRRATTTVATVAAVLVAALSCAACSKPEPPDTDRPPEPKAQPESPQATEMRDAIRKPIDRAKAVEGQVQDAAAKQQAAIDAQTGG